MKVIVDKKILLQILQRHNEFWNALYNTGDSGPKPALSFDFVIMSSSPIDPIVYIGVRTRNSTGFLARTEIDKNKGLKEVIEKGIFVASPNAISRLIFSINKSSIEEIVLSTKLCKLYVNNKPLIKGRKV